MTVGHAQATWFVSDCNMCTWMLLFCVGQVVYLDNVVNNLLIGHKNHYQHKTLLSQHQSGSMTPILQVRQHLWQRPTHPHSQVAKSLDKSLQQPWAPVDTS